MNPYLDHFLAIRATVEDLISHGWHGWLAEMMAPLMVQENLTADEAWKRVDPVWRD
jgi:hypothetical protein